MAINIDFSKFRTPEKPTTKKKARRVWPWDAPRREIKEDAPASAPSPQADRAHAATVSEVHNLGAISTQDEIPPRIKTILGEQSTYVENTLRNDSNMASVGKRSKHVEDKSTQVTKSPRLNSNLGDTSSQEEIPPRRENHQGVPLVEEFASAREIQERSLELIRQTSQGLRAGFGRLPHHLWMDIVSGELSKTEIQMLLLVGRYTLGFPGRKQAPLSQSAIKQLTGLGGREARAALHKLVERAVIFRIPGDVTKPSEFGLIYDESLFEKRKDLKQDLGEKTIKDEISPRGENHPGENSTSVINAPLYPYKKRYKETITLSQQPALQKVNQYLSDLKPKRKRESEFFLFQELLTEYTAEDVADCFGEIFQNGELKTGEGVHSPFAYLSKAMPQVRLRVQERRGREATTDQEREAAKKKHLEMEERLKAEQEEWGRVEAAFQKKFTTDDEQSAFIDSFAKKNYTRFRPPAEIIRRAAIKDWYKCQRDDA